MHSPWPQISSLKDNFCVILTLNALINIQLLILRPCNFEIQRVKFEKTSASAIYRPKTAIIWQVVELVDFSIHMNTVPIVKCEQRSPIYDSPCVQSHNFHGTS